MALYERFEELLGESVRAPKVGDQPGFFSRATPREGLDGHVFFLH